MRAFIGVHAHERHSGEAAIDLTLRGAVLTDLGRQRPINEDWAGSRNPEGARRSIWAVADGVSGFGTGREAARLAVETSVQVVADDARPAETALREAFARVNHLLLEKGRVGTRGPGEARGPTAPSHPTAHVTTLLVVSIEADRAVLANVGDCRAYLVRGGQALQLTRDHTWVADQVAAGALQPREALSHPRRNAITRCLGQEPNVVPDIVRRRLVGDDVLILCSDGLTRHVADHEIARASGIGGPDQIARALIELANARGGSDNIAVAVIQTSDPTTRAGGGDVRPAASRAGLATGTTYESSRSSRGTNDVIARPPAREPGRRVTSERVTAAPRTPGVDTTLHQRILNSVSSGIVTLDRAGVVISVNPAAQAMLSLPEGGAIGRPLASLVPPDLLRGLGLTFTGDELGSTIHGADLAGELPERGRVYFRHRLSPLRDEHGVVDGYILVLDDETDRVRLEQDRRDAHVERERVQAIFGRYVSPAVYDEIMRRGLDASGVVGEQREITVLFADIRGFTGLAERLTPVEVVELLNRYLGLATDVIFRNNGTIDKFMGDAVMALFGAPVPIPGHPLLAVRAALAMQEAFARLPANDSSRASFGIGINTGEGIVGTIGAPRLMSYTAIGDVVNVAARLQSEARPGEILIGADTHRQVAATIEAEPLGTIYVKGRLAPVSTYKVSGLRAGEV